MTGKKELFCFLDETGDHSLEKIDKDFPIFVLTAVLVGKQKYIEHIIPKTIELKLKYFPHEGIILHSRDIRKALNEFSILQNKEVRDNFNNDFANLITGLKFGLIVSIIRKENLKERYIKPFNPYDLSLMFILERLAIIVESGTNVDIGKIILIAESRGKNEDNELKLSFYRIISNGTNLVDKAYFEKRKFELHFVEKRRNVVGNQIADICGYPFGRNVLNPEQKNIAYSIVKGKILDNVKGWENYKIFP